MPISAGDGSGMESVATGMLLELLLQAGNMASPIAAKRKSRVKMLINMEVLKCGRLPVFVPRKERIISGGIKVKNQLAGTADLTPISFEIRYMLSF